MGVKSVRSVSLGVVWCCGSCRTIFVLGTAIVRVTVFVFGLVICFASATILLLEASISSRAAHFVSSSTRSISMRMAFNACCMSCNALLFILLFSNKQVGVMQNHHLVSVSTWCLKTAALKFSAQSPFSDDEIAQPKLQCYLSNSRSIAPPPHCVTINLLVTLLAKLYKSLS